MGEPLSYTEIEAWSRLTSRQLASFEVLAIKELDNILRDVFNARNRKPDHQS